MKLLLKIAVYAIIITICGCKEEVFEINAPKPIQHNSKVANFLDSLRYHYDLPALAGAIVTGSGIIDAQAVGCRKYGGEMNVTNNDRFHLGSCTKALTAVLLGILVDEGKIKWSTTLKEVFPELANEIRGEYKDVTLEQLLSHSSGLPRDPVTFSNSGTAKDQRYEVVKTSLLLNPAVPKGKYLYSNLGMIIAGAIAEKLTGEQYEQLLITKVLLPLGITSGGFGAMGTKGLEDQPLQHEVNDLGQRIVIDPDATADNHPVYSPAGRLYLTIGDWGKFISWVIRCENGNATLVSQATAKKLTSKIVPADGDGYYAMGWTIVDRDWANGKVIAHSGCNGWNYCSVWIAPNRNFAVMTMTNQGEGITDRYMAEITNDLLNLYLNKKY
jgi:CubicO group peptidase (beta-lactamase class C family)